MRAARNVPIWVQQLGRKSADDPTLEYMHRALQKMQENRVGFGWWQWKQNTSNPGEYALNYKGPNGAGWVAKEEEISLLSQFMKGRMSRDPC